MTLACRLSAVLGEDVAELRDVAGGCIAEARRVRLASGRTVFVKTAATAMLEQEANGLRELRRAAALAIPEVLHAEPDLLVLEYIETGAAGPSTMSDFGRGLALMHRFSSETFGFAEDNFIGASSQQNTPPWPRTNGWAGFWYTYRLVPQLRLAEANGRATDELRRLITRLESKLPSLLGDGEPPALLHGDLWGGNYLIATSGCVWLIDPAVYYGHREADLAMTSLFGGFDRSFYDAYAEAYPLAAGAAERVPLYQAYHLLNHLNLFGGSYYKQAVHALRRYV